MYIFAAMIMKEVKQREKGGKRDGCEREVGERKTRGKETTIRRKQ